MQTDTEQLATEAAVFVGYLLNRPVDEYVVRKYVEFHSGTAGAQMQTGATEFDRFLVRFARRGRLRTRLADSYAAIFHRESLIRKKLVLMAALLECSPAHHEVIDRPDSGNTALIALALTSRLAVFAMSAIAGALVFLPVRSLMMLRPGLRERQTC